MTPNHNKTGLLDGLLWGIGILLSIFFLAWIFNYGLEKQDKVDCLKWQNEAKSRMLANYYITSVQKAQCDTYNIIIDAPVK